MSAGRRVGPVVAIGGAEDRENESTVLQDVLKLAGKPSASIVLMTVATEHPEEVGKEYTDTFARLGYDNVTIVDVSKREDALDQERIAAIAGADGIFFTGGDQLFITSLLGGTPMEQCLHDRHQAGAVIAGTSAGAAMMGTSMIVSGTSDENPRSEAVSIAPGMDFLERMTIDTHFSQRGRHGRLLTAIAHYPRCLGVGIDEDTGIVVKGTGLTVIGSGSVTLMDFSSMTYSSLPELERNESLTLHDITVHVLSGGHRFDLAERRPLAD